MSQDFKKRKQPRKYAFELNQLESNSKIQFIYNLLHQKISQNIQLREKAGIPQDQVRFLLKELSDQQPSKNAKELYQRLLIEANTQLKLLSLPRVYKAKHRDLTLQTALRDFQETYGISPYQYVKQQIIQKSHQKESEYSGVITRDDVNFSKFGGQMRQRRERMNPYSGQMNHDFDSKETFLQQELNNPDLMNQKKLLDKYFEQQMNKQGLLLNEKKEEYKTQDQIAQLSKKQSEQQRNKRLENERIQNEIVQNMEGEYVKRSQLRILNSQINKKGPLQGLPNYLVIPRKDMQKLDIINQDTGKVVNNKTKKFDVTAFDPKMLEGKTMQQIQQLADLYNGQVMCLNGREMASGADFNLDQKSLDQLSTYIENGDFQRALAQIQQGDPRIRSKIDADDLKQQEQQKRLKKQGTLQQIQYKPNEKFNKLIEKQYLMQHVESDYILKALRAGIVVDNFIYKQMVNDYPQWNQLVYKRNLKVIARKKYPTYEEALKQIPLTKGEIDFFQAQRRFNGKFKQQYDQICQQIKKHDDLELYEELAAEHASLEELGRRYKKQRKDDKVSDGSSEIDYFKSQKFKKSKKMSKSVIENQRIQDNDDDDDDGLQQQRIQREIYDMAEKIKVVKKYPKLLSR